MAEPHEIAETCRSWIICLILQTNGESHTWSDAVLKITDKNRDGAWFRLHPHSPEPDCLRAWLLNLKLDEILFGLGWSQEIPVPETSKALEKIVEKLKKLERRAA